MVTLERSRSILEQNGKKYTDSEIILIRDFLYTMAAIDFKLNQAQIKNEKTRHYLHSSIDR